MNIRTSFQVENLKAINPWVVKMPIYLYELQLESIEVCDKYHDATINFSDIKILNIDNEGWIEI